MKFLTRLFKKPTITVATFKRKEVDCSLKNQIHQKLMQELKVSDANN